VKLPETIERAIDREAATVPGKALARAADALSARYRDRTSGPLGLAQTQAQTQPQPHARVPALTDIERLAYAVVRAPATYAAVASVLDELQQRAPDLRIASLLDLGAGPGAATWAALARRADLARVTLIERDPGFIDLGRRLLSAETADIAAAADSAAPAGTADAADTAEAADRPDTDDAPRIEWQCADVRALPNLPAHDLVIISYALGELDAAAAQHCVERAWAATRQALIVIEPGTPRHFAGVLAARDLLIRAGAFIAAPCPHAAACPMAGVDDWCHMPARLERTSLHRRLKAAALPYEDEKFSYVIATREPAQRASARIVRRPEIQKGFVALTLCTPSGLQREGVARSRKEAFRRARKADWGDGWDVTV